ncbi:Aft1 HRA domain-containing protein [Dipodascopsis uninucleata]
MTGGSPHSNTAATSPSSANNRENRGSSFEEGSSYGNATRSKFDLEPNPFEQSFASKEGTPTSSSKAVLPPVASITSPSSLINSGSNSGFNWGINSLRSGPLSPAMLQGPQTAAAMAFVDSHLRTGLTPNESGIRTGLTPGGSGSIFPAPSPTTAALFGLVPQTPNGLQASSFPQTPQPIDHTTATSQPTNLSVTSGATTSTVAAALPVSTPSVSNSSSATYPGQAILSNQTDRHLQVPNNQANSLNQNHKQEPFADSASAAANGLFMLSQSQQQAAQTSARKDALASTTSDENTAPNDIRTDKRKNNNLGGRKGNRKADNESMINNKRRKTMARNDSATPSVKGEDDYGSDTQNKSESSTGSSNSKNDNKKMTDEEKRKNFLERNRVAALKCRQRKKQWLANLQAKVEYYGNENDALNAQVTALREQVVSLKALLLSHKDCSTSRALPPGQDPINIALGQDFVAGLQAGIGQPQSGVPGLGQSVMPNMAGARRYL